MDITAQDIVSLLVLIPIAVGIVFALGWFLIKIFWVIALIAFKLAMLALTLGLVFTLMVFLTTGHMPW